MEDSRARQRSPESTRAGGEVKRYTLVNGGSLSPTLGAKKRRIAAPIDKANYAEIEIAAGDRRLPACWRLSGFKFRE